MKAFVFAAGLGTRLKPLTDNCPKALVKLNRKPLLWHTINYLERFGVNFIVVNIHHFGEQIIEYVKCQKFSAKIVISDERDLLLDTGGGLLKAKEHFKGEEPFLAINVDVVASVDLGQVIRYHIENNNMATLVVRNRETSRYFLFDNNLQLSGWKNSATGEQTITRNTVKEITPLAFSGIQVISPKLFSLVNNDGKFSVTPMYLKLSESEKIMGFIDNSDFWLDLGKPGQISIAEKYLNSLKS